MDDIVESLNDVGLKDRSMVWNTDLVEVSFTPFLSSMCPVTDYAGSAREMENSADLSRCTCFSTGHWEGVERVVIMLTDTVERLDKAAKADALYSTVPFESSGGSHWQQLQGTRGGYW